MLQPILAAVSFAEIWASRATRHVGVCVVEKKKAANALANVRYDSLVVVDPAHYGRTAWCPNSRTENSPQHSEQPEENYNYCLENMKI